MATSNYLNVSCFHSQPEIAQSSGVCKTALSMELTSPTTRPTLVSQVRFKLSQTARYPALKAFAPPIVTLALPRQLQQTPALDGHSPMGPAPSTAAPPVTSGPLIGHASHAMHHVTHARALPPRSAPPALSGTSSPLGTPSPALASAKRRPSPA